jgi:hypothetical protein
MLAEMLGGLQDAELDAFAEKHQWQKRENGNFFVGSKVLPPPRAFFARPLLALALNPQPISLSPLSQEDVIKSKDIVESIEFACAYCPRPRGQRPNTGAHKACCPQRWCP